MRKSNTKDEALKIGKELDSYLRFRAGEEGEVYGFTPNFFAKAVTKGCINFFGISFDKGKLIADEEQPELFKKWKLRN